jgi:hypothetical protein
MKRRLLGLLAGACLVVGCETTKDLDSNNANVVRNFAPEAVASSTQFLGGAAVDLSSVTKLVQQGASNHSKIASMLTKSSAGKVFSAFQASSLSSTNLGLQNNLCDPPTVVDQDGDGIPNNFDYPLNCVVKTAGGSFSYKGNIFYNDTNDNDANSGYTAKVTDLIFQVNSGTSIARLTTNYTVTVGSFANGKYIVKQDFRYSAYAKDDDFEGTIAYAYTSDLNYTPAPSIVASNRFQKGTVDFTSTFRFLVDIPPEKFVINMTYKAENLKVDRLACGTAKMVNGGIVRISDGKGNVLVWTIQDISGDGNACGEGVWTYNGKPVQ